MIGDLIAALTWPIDVAQELKEMQDGPAVVTDYASLLRAQQEYKVRTIQLSIQLGRVADSRQCSSKRTDHYDHY
jgi:hypothetical protein